MSKNSSQSIKFDAHKRLFYYNLTKYLVEVNINNMMELMNHLEIIKEKVSSVQKIRRTIVRKSVESPSQF